MSCDPRNAGILNCTDTEKAPVISNVIPIHCERHQAPHGYKYVNQNDVCVLMQSDTHRIITQPGYAPPILAINAVPVAAASGDIVATGLNWVSNNKGLAALIALAAVWAISKNK